MNEMIAVNITKNTIDHKNEDIKSAFNWFDIKGNLLKTVVAPILLIDDTQANIKTINGDTVIRVVSDTLNSFEPHSRPYQNKVNEVSKALQMMNRMRTSNGIYSKQGE